MTSRWCIAAGGLWVATVVVAAAGVAYLLREGLSARAEPSALEARAARALRSLAVPADARAARNPVPESPQAIAVGLAHFADHCASCHANDGSGRTPLGRSLYPRAPDLRARRTQALTDGELFHVIEHGVRLTGMPAWGRPGSAEASWELVRFIRHLPKLTPEELARMEALNPKSPDEWRKLEAEEAFLRGDAPPSGGEHGDHADHGGHSH